MSIRNLKNKFSATNNFGYGAPTTSKSLLDKINPIEIAREKKRQEEYTKRRIEGLKNCVAELEKEFYQKLSSFYANHSSFYSLNSSEYVYSELIRCIERISRENAALEQLSSLESQSATIHALSKQAEAFRRYENYVHQITTTIMIDPDNYGQIRPAYWRKIASTSLQHIRVLLETWELAFSQNNYDLIYTINPEEVLECLWGFAITKPYCAADVQRVRTVLGRIYKKEHIETFIAELYAQTQVGGENVIRESIRTYLKRYGTENPSALPVLASSLMWMKAYQAEEDVLQYMLTNRIQMTAKTQERLHTLSRGGGNNPDGLNRVSRQDMLYLDISALAWKDEDYAGLFDTLAFQDKQLSYSLAIRSEDKDLMVARELVIPTMEQILKKLDTAFNEEYGGSVSVGVTDCTALSDGNEECFSAILLTPTDCKQLSILTYVMRIGRKLNIKFYTLFMPTEASLPVQKQQAISLLKKLSPSVSMWEDSIKSTALMAIQQLLNTSDQPNLGTYLPDSQNFNNPIF